ncbi:hypothetical protein EA26_16535 [Vibrio navarrensis]|uniref:Uncharacterized protein n=1 Tax=Vibrio navarrensis TaxID=29495 RepID=A0A099LL08_9VIBR|nr:hypothetical protein EA26_16535 [Vibrio navarrensis]MBE4580353.1 hypothetical protein [Vibrio navarrensis]MBE4614317.1 hypothetical protein [Vibrio navarrensis]
MVGFNKWQSFCSLKGETISLAIVSSVAGSFTSINQAVVSISDVNSMVDQNVAGISQRATAMEELARLAEEQQRKLLEFRV